MLSTPLIGVLHLSYNTKHHICCMTQLIIRAFLKFLVYECFVLLQPHECIKLQPHSQLCCFLGYYGIEQKGHKCYDPVAKRLRISRNVVFWEHKMPYTLSISWILLLQLSMWILFQTYSLRSHLPTHFLMNHLFQFLLSPHHLPYLQILQLLILSFINLLG